MPSHPSGSSSRCSQSSIFTFMRYLSWGTILDHFLDPKWPPMAPQFLRGAQYWNPNSPKWRHIVPEAPTWSPFGAHINLSGVFLDPRWPQMAHQFSKGTLFGDLVGLTSTYARCTRQDLFQDYSWMLMLSDEGKTCQSLNFHADPNAYLRAVTQHQHPASIICLTVWTCFSRGRRHGVSH